MFWTDDGARVGLRPMLMEGSVLVSCAATTAKRVGSAMKSLMVKWAGTKSPSRDRELTVVEYELDAAWYGSILQW